MHLFGKPERKLEAVHTRIAGAKAADHLHNSYIIVVGIIGRFEDIAQCFKRTAPRNADRHVVFQYG